MWVCIGFASDAPNAGDVQPLEFMELPLLMVRDSDNTLRVFHNVCRHRGHVLVSERGTVKQSLRCPYHSWTYTLEGKLARTPNIGGVGISDVEGFNRQEFGLVQVDSVEWHDLVFINLSGNAPAFEDFIAPLEQRWKPFWGAEGASLLRLAEAHSSIRLEVQANWKLAVENYLEAYHLPTVHPALNQISPLAEHEIHFDEDFAGQLSHCYTLGAGGGRHLPVFPSWPEALYCVGDEAVSEDFGDLRQAQHGFWTDVFAEDIGVVTGMQAGRASPGFDGGVLTPVMETATAQFHQWVAQRVGENLGGN